jgi:hypothetical protein
MGSDTGLYDMKHLRKGIVEHMVGVLGRYLEQGSFYSFLSSGVGWGSEVLLEQVQLSFCFQNKFIIVLQYGLLVVDSNTFLKSYWLH